MRRKAERRFIFAFFFLVYALTASGDLIGDTELRWLVAQRFLDTGWVDLPAGTSLLLAEGNEGKHYSFYGPGQSTLFVPIAKVGRWMAAKLPFAVDADSVGQLLASLVFFPICGALAVTIAHAIATNLSNESVARWVVFAYGLATMHWQNTVNTYEESQVAICVLTALWALERDRVQPRFLWRWAAFGAMAVAVAFRVSSIVIITPLVFVYFVYALRQAFVFRAEGLPTISRTLSGWITAALMGLGPIVILLGLYNMARFGVPWESGYARAIWDEPGGVRLFETPLHVGLAGLLLSPGKSVFLYNPILLLAIPGWVYLRRMRPTAAFSILASTIATLLFHAKYTFWAGDLAWGPRYLASSMGLYSLALTPIFLRFPRFRRVTVLILVLSGLIQLASIVYNFGLEFYQDRRHGIIPDAYVWRPAESQLVCRLRNLALHAAGRPIYESIPPVRERPVTHNVVSTPESVRCLHAVNVFPFKARAFGVSKKVVAGLFALWAADSLRF